MASRIEKVWMCPPLAFARVGSAKEPLEAYFWGPNDTTPRGTDKTTIVPMETLYMDTLGEITSRIPDFISFRVFENNKERFKPVCPWYELHGIVIRENEKYEGPITEAILIECGFTLNDISWNIKTANKKAFYMTLEESDIISGELIIEGNDTLKKELKGISVKTAKFNSLVPEDANISLGHVQVAKPNKDFPEIRIRIFAPKGAVYGPKNVKTKITDLIKRYGVGDIGSEDSEDKWNFLNIETENLILNDDAAWCTLTLENGDSRTIPVAQFAYQKGPMNVLNSLGLIDDFSEGTLTCRLKNNGVELLAEARVVVSPADFVPDRRHVVTLADVFKDRSERKDLQGLYDNLPIIQMSQDVLDIFERIWETAGLMNIDAMNTKFQEPGTNNPPFDKIPFLDRFTLPLTERAREIHRRLKTLEVLEDYFREIKERVEIASEPGFASPVSIMDRINRPPNEDGTTPQSNSYKKMPAVMRGSDGNPMYITRRQYELLMLWANKLREDD